MTIAAVLAKHVPIGGAFLRVEDGGFTREGVSHGLDPINELGLEWALQQREAGAVERVIVIAMGPADAVDTVRRGLAVGADAGMLVTDAALAGADVRQTARALAGAIRHVGAKLAVFGYESLDGSSGTVPAAVAALLDRPLISRLREAEVDGGVLRGRRDLGDGLERVEAELPVVVSLVEGRLTPRFPKIKDIIRTKAAEVETLSAADVGAAWPLTRAETVTALRATPVTPKNAEVVDIESGVERILDLLADAGVLDR